MGNNQCKVEHCENDVWRNKKLKSKYCNLHKCYIKDCTNKASMLICAYHRCTNEWCSGTKMKNSDICLACFHKKRRKGTFSNN